MDNYAISNSKNRFFSFLVSVFILSVFFPIMNTVVESVFMGIIISVGIIFFPNKVFTKPFYNMCCFMVVAFAYLLLGKGLPLITLILNSLYFLSSIVITLNLNSLSRKQQKWLLYFLLGLFLYSVIGTFIILLDSPLAVRLYGYGQGFDSFGQDLYIKYRIRGMYTYGMGEALAVFLPALLIFAFNAKNRIISAVCLFIVLFGALTQMMAALTTSFLLTVIFSAIAVLSFFSVNKQKSRLRIAVLVIIIIIPGVIYVSTFSDYNAAFMMKVEDVTESYEGGQTTGQVQTRADLYNKSIAVCLHNPIFGFGNHPQVSNTTDNVIGLHAAIFDYWGLFGVFTLFLYFSWKNSIKSFYVQLDRQRKKSYQWFYFSLLFLLLLKGPVTIATNFLFSTVFVGLLCTIDKNNNLEVIV